MVFRLLLRAKYANFWRVAFFDSDLTEFPIVKKVAVREKICCISNVLFLAFLFSQEPIFQEVGYS